MFIFFYYVFNKHIYYIFNKHIYYVFNKHIYYELKYIYIHLLKNNDEKVDAQNFKCVFELEDKIFWPENDRNSISVKTIGLVLSFLYPHSTPRSEFPIKSYDRSKMRCSDFVFIFRSNLCLFDRECRIN
jgi:hypothetical protein